MAFDAVMGQEYTDGRLAKSKVYKTTKAFLSEGHTAWDSFLSNASASVSFFALRPGTSITCASEYDLHGRLV